MPNRNFLSRSVFVLILLFAFGADAETFRNDYVSFELPNRWTCDLQGTEWICKSKDQKGAKEAIIILTAKEVGPSDSLALYEAYLKKPKNVPDSKGRPQTSEVKSVKQSQINGHAWVDGLQLGSEIPTYYTRYLATVKQRIAVLVTFSAHKRYYTKYSADFLKAIRSLRLVGDGANPTGMQNIKSSNETIGGTISSHMADDLLITDDLPDEPKSGSGNMGFFLLILGLAVAVVGGYYIYTKKND